MPHSIHLAKVVVAVKKNKYFIERTIENVPIMGNNMLEILETFWTYNERSIKKKVTYKKTDTIPEWHLQNIQLIKFLTFTTWE
jgi:hypothetical protein